MRVLRNSGRVSWRSMLKQLPQQVDLQRLLPIQRCGVHLHARAPVLHLSRSHMSASHQ